ncbi:MAG: hypothetical protein SFV18_13000 [Bryobacteraceae bacterium]|nr:hypothetical protein [Bryobacteraceae bacterium]
MDQRNFEYMCYGLIAAWGVLMIYVATLIGRERRLKSEVETLKKLIEEKSRHEA